MYQNVDKIYCMIYAQGKIKHRNRCERFNCGDVCDSVRSKVRKLTKE